MSKAHRTAVRTAECQAPGCDKPQHSRVYCSAHASRLRRTGSLGDTPIGEYARQGCLAGDCDKPHARNGYCVKHATRIERHGDPDIVLPDATQLHRVGAEAPRWTGDEATYGAVHKRHDAELGPAKDHPCVDCDEAAVNWSYDGGCPDEKVEDGLLYCVHNEHYSPRCWHHHRIKDGLIKSHCKRGHLLPEFEPGVRRHCQECRADAGRQRIAAMTAAKHALGVPWRRYLAVFGQSGVMAECVLWAAEACAAAEARGE